MRVLQGGQGGERPRASAARGGLAIKPPSHGIALADQPVQRLATRSGGDAAAVHRSAEAGVQDGGHRLPHFDAVERAFGDVDLGAIRAHTSPRAAASAAAIGASAYAIGGHVAFARPCPSLHDVAHVVQQRAGVRLPGGVGQVGDRHERHADAVARANAEAHAQSLMGEDYVGTTHAITEADALAAIARGRSVSAGYEFTQEKTIKDNVASTRSVPKASNKYIYNITGKASFMPGNRINCARYAAKLLAAAGVGSGWFEVRPRGGMFFKTPGQVATGLFGQSKN